MPRDAESVNQPTVTEADRRTLVPPQSVDSRPSVAPVTPPRRRRSLNMAAHKIEYYRYH